MCMLQSSYPFLTCKHRSPVYGKKATLLLNRGQLLRHPSPAYPSLPFSSSFLAPSQLLAISGMRKLALGSDVLFSGPTAWSGLGFYCWGFFGCCSASSRVEGVCVWGGGGCGSHKLRGLSLWLSSSSTTHRSIVLPLLWSLSPHLSCLLTERNNHVHL